MSSWVTRQEEIIQVRQKVYLLGTNPVWKDIVVGSPIQAVIHLIILSLDTALAAGIQEVTTCLLAPRLD